MYMYVCTCIYGKGHSIDVMVTYMVTYKEFIMHVIMRSPLQSQPLNVVTTLFIQCMFMLVPGPFQSLNHSGFCKYGYIYIHVHLYLYIYMYVYAHVRIYTYSMCCVHVHVGMTVIEYTHNIYIVCIYTQPYMYSMYNYTCYVMYVCTVLSKNFTTMCVKPESHRYHLQ